MKYCKETTEGHDICTQYPEGLETLNHIFSAEGYPTNLFLNEKGINIDKIEIKRCTGSSSRKPTMDLAIGLSREGRNRQILLVELKFKVKNPANITKADIESKIKHSIDILSYSPPVSDNKVLLFNDKQIAIAKSYIARLYGKPPKAKIQVKSAREFKEEYFKEPTS